MKRLCFRPQQGLIIMNLSGTLREFATFDPFPSPTGVTNYESYEKMASIKGLEEFPSPTGVTNYE